MIALDGVYTVDKSGKAKFHRVNEIQRARVNYPGFHRFGYERVFTLMAISFRVTA
jgi:hypothetical protein